MKRQFFQSRIGLILLGVALGWVARLLLGAPAADPGPVRAIDRPLRSVDGESEPLSQQRAFPDQGLVPPIEIPQYQGIVGDVKSDEAWEVQYSRLLFDDDSHDAAASFEAHGEELCASGCAVSRHPTSILSQERFQYLLDGYASGAMDATNESLEELLFYGPQTRKLISSVGIGQLERLHARFLWEQLTFTHAKISIRVTDDQGVVRSWIDPTRVPFDRRHVFQMDTNQVQSLVTSGTVKRVGLNHIWTRL